MRTLVSVVCWAAITTVGVRAGELLDRVDDALTWHTPDGAARARVSGLLDAEEYALPDPRPGLISSDHAALFNPRLTLFLDAQAGANWYGFVQARVDRGFDPADDVVRSRLDEYALRWTPSQRGRVDVEVGKFATVVGNWTARHDSWSNPFITAPLPYENLTGVWDNAVPHSPGQLLLWSHMQPGLGASIVDQEKYIRLPIIWGPSYGTGFAVAGAMAKFRYAVEVKNASLASRPDAWSPRESAFAHPTISGRVRYVPDEAWEFGVSASSGAFLRPVAGATLAPSAGRGEYRQEVLAHDLSYAWHHLQIWAEIYLARFHLPGVANADTAAYYVETRYRFTPQFSGALRFNQELFGTIENHGHATRWGHDTWRVDVAPSYRLTPHAQLKFQYSLQRGGQDAGFLTQLAAVQATLRF